MTKLLTVLAMGAAVTFGLSTTASADDVCRGAHEIRAVDNDLNFVTDEGTISGPCITGPITLAVTSAVNNPDGTFTHVGPATVSDGSFQTVSEGSYDKVVFDPATCHLHQELSGTVTVTKGTATGDFTEVTGGGTFYDVIDLYFPGAPYNCDTTQPPISGKATLALNLDVLKVKRQK
jgi:hypothetical protein